MTSKAERTVRERYPSAKARAAWRSATWFHIWRAFSDGGLAILGSGPTRAAAWRDAASKLPPKESEA